jgi:predicted DNA-binding transcriptional regulator AlpA
MSHPSSSSADNPTLRFPSAFDLLTQMETAELIKYSPRSLEGLRRKGEGPPYVKLSARSIRYRRADVLAWIEAHLVNGPSSNGDAPRAGRGARRRAAAR